MPSLDKIINYHPVFDWLGTAGQPDREQLKDVRVAGYQAVINLALVTSQNAIADEADLVVKLGMAYYHLPVLWENPKQTDLDRFFDLLDGLKGKKIFVHCVLNMRVSVFVYLYRIIKMGETEESARGDLLEIWQPDGIWKEFIIERLEFDPFI